MFAPNIIYTVFVVSLGYFVVLTVYYIFLAAVGSIEEMKRAMQGETEDYSLFYFSSLKLPVSIILPAHNEEDWIADSLKSLLNINYPEFEIIVVNDGSTDGTFDILNKLLKLKPVDAMYIKHYKDGRLRGVLKSELYPNVTVVDKDRGNKKAGAVNAGLNMAKHDYICVMDADTILERDALLKVMAQVEKEPDKIIGVGSYFGLINGFKIKNGAIMDRSCSYNPIVAYQNIEYIRSFIGNRLAWSRFNAMPNVAGGFGVWRKDVLYELGGFSADFTCEDIELTFRAHDYIVKNKDKGYKIAMLPFYVGWTEGPDNIPALIMQRNRWQRVVNETIWRYKYMTCNPKYGSFGFLAMPYFVLYEVFGVFMEVISIAFVTAGWIMGVLNIHIFLAYLLFMLLSQAFVSLLSMLAFVEGQRLFKMRYIAYLIMLTLTEFFFYRWIISISKIIGTISSLRGIRSYDQYARSKRT
ncbi:MAG: glycosyltransferase family 2 protein [Candidatus Omnitrophota bacterium]|nr:glycosyltransferase family 2 protein [Candidatus Omnitrophota bacterium]